MTRQHKKARECFLAEQAARSLGQERSTPGPDKRLMLFVAAAYHRNVSQCRMHDRLRLGELRYVLRSIRPAVA
jgi:hypothetical protein